MYKNMQTFAFKVLRELSFWASKNAFSDTNQVFVGKFVK